MKKIISVLIAVLMISALCVPALADRNAKEETNIFDTAFTLVGNEPTIEYDDWGVPYNVWVPSTEPFAAGDTVTFTLTYTVPETIEEYDPKLLGSIEFLTSYEGIAELELVEAFGCPQKVICDYELGFCMPVPGEYANVTVEDGTCIVMAELGSTVQVVLRGVATADEVTCNADITIGQYRFPAQYMIGDSVVTLEKHEDGFYKASRSDFFLVQKRSVVYINNEDSLVDMFAGLNNHYYRAVVGDHDIEQFIPVDDDFVDCGEPIDPESSTFATLISIMEEYKELFGICYCSAALTDESFFDASLAKTFNVNAVLGAEPETTPVPEEPTPEPGEPSPTPITPITGAISLTAIGVVSILSGAGLMFARREED